MNNKNKVAIIGAGNLGIYLCALYKNKGYDVTLFTDKEYTSNNIKIYSNGSMLYSEDIKISKSKSISNFDLCIITYPVHILRQRLSEYKISDRILIYYIIGEGDISSLLKGYKNKIVVFSRVPAISRLIDQNSANVNVKEQDIVYTVLNGGNDTKIEAELNSVFDNRLLYCSNPAAITLTPTNQIIHTSRIYNLFKNNLHIDNDMYFYADWTDEDSQLLIAMSDEIHNCAELLHISDYVPEVLNYYQCNDYKELTQKIRSIKSLSKIKLPIIVSLDGDYKYKLNVKSRYVVSDFDFGLRSIKELLNKYDLKSDSTQMILDWFDKNVKVNE